MINSSSKPGRRGPRLILALVLGAAAAAGVYFYVNSVQQQAQQTARQQAQQTIAAAAARQRVAVAKVTIPAKAALTSDNIELREFSNEAVMPNAVTTMADLQGKQLSVAVAAGEQILSHRIEDPTNPEVRRLADMVPVGKRAMSVTFSELSSAGGLIVPGDYVDVIAVFNKNTLGKDQSMILLQDVLVLAVAQNTSVEQLARENQPGAASAAAQAAAARGGSQVLALPTPVLVPAASSATRTVTLAVDPEAAERLALAEDYGRLRYIVRTPTDRSQNAIVPADLATLASPIQVAAGQILATEISPANTKVGDVLEVKVTVRNTSDRPMQTMGPQPGYQYTQDQTYFSQQYNSEPGKWRVAIGSAGLDIAELPYRWGLGADLAPGATTTVTGTIKVTKDFKTTNFWAALVEEPGKVVQTGVGMTLVTSLPEKLAIVAVDSANVRSEASIASSVVDQISYGTELQIIGQSGDWYKVKLPDGREGWVAAGWIVTAGR